MKNQNEHVLRRAQNVSAAIAAVCLLVGCIGAWKETVSFFHSYVFVFLFWIGIPVGSALVLCFANLTSAGWIEPVRATLESAARSFFVFAIAAIPLLLGMRRVYAWASNNGNSFPAYLNMPFWIARMVVLLGLWTLLFNRTASTDTVIRLRWSAATAVALPITAAFAYVDWFMSIESEWRSTAFGITVLSSQVLAAISLVLVLLPALQSKVELDVRRLHQLGNLLLTFVLFWAYLAFSQFLIIYSANLPHEIGWYQQRSKGAWLVITAIVAIGQFFLPFLMLLFRGVKRSMMPLALVAGVILISNALYCYWLTAPSFGDSGKAISWLDPVLFFGMGSIFALVFIDRLRGAEPTVPLGSIPGKTKRAYAAC